jgi:hypothetical protein
VDCAERVAWGAVPPEIPKVATVSLDQSSDTLATAAWDGSEDVSHVSVTVERTAIESRFIKTSQTLRLHAADRRFL